MDLKSEEFITLYTGLKVKESNAEELSIG